ncbi:MAG: kelch repeat-containing protein, partial [Acidimicrobiales bacterium]
GFGPPTASTGDSPVRLDDTWTWNGQTWTPRTPPVKPPARAKAAMASLAGQVVLFGGEAGLPAGGALGDTWTWNGTTGTWTGLNPPTAPSPRQGPVMAYHPPTQGLLLFGGSTSGSEELNDTWVWTGSKWKQKFPLNSPSPRVRVAMAHHAPTATTMLFGGEVNGTTLGDTWAWNGTNWKRR